MTKIEVEKVIDALPEVIIKALVNDEKVVMKGFLSFETYDRTDKVGFNPYTKKYETFEGKKAVKCKIGKPILDAINN